MSTDSTNEPEPKTKSLPRLEQWYDAPFEEGVTWQGPQEEWQSQVTINDFSPEGIEAAATEIRTRLEADSQLDLTNPKLWRELSQTLGLNGSTVSIAAYIVNDERALAPR